MFSQITPPSSGHSGLSVEQLNRENFRACLEALARPGQLRKIISLFDAPLLAVASVLLYSEVRYWYRGELADFQLIEAMTGATAASASRSHYLFADAPSVKILEQAYPGSLEHPETSATCIFLCPDTEGTAVHLRGPGIKDTTMVTLPLARDIVDYLILEKPIFPLGLDLLLVNNEGGLLGLPRTTRIEVLS